jgi:4'-phosphopantetheinyl transferase
VATVSVWLGPVPTDTSACVDSERRRAERFRSEEPGQRWLAARALLRRILGDVTGTPARALTIVEAEGGKPVLADWPGVHFNLSHSGTVVAVAVADRPVGIDVEAGRRLRSPDGVARRLGLDAGTPHDDVIRAWVRTEALLKATGTGARAGLAGVEARLVPEGWTVRDLVAAEDLVVGVDVVAAVAARGTALALRGPVSTTLP